MVDIIYISVIFTKHLTAFKAHTLLVLWWYWIGLIMPGSQVHGHGRRGTFSMKSMYFELKAKDMCISHEAGQLNRLISFLLHWVSSLNISSVRRLALFTSDHHAVTNEQDTASYFYTALFSHEQNRSVIRQVPFVHVGNVAKVNTRTFCEYKSAWRLIESRVWWPVCAHEKRRCPFCFVFFYPLFKANLTDRWVNLECECWCEGRFFYAD